MSAPGTSDGAFDRITVERVPQDATGRPWHVEVHHPGYEIPLGTVPDTWEHLNLSPAELIALYDHISGIVLGLR